jgi:hypothetical protein
MCIYGRDYQDRNSGHWNPGSAIDGERFAGSQLGWNSAWYFDIGRFVRSGLPPA